MLNLAIIRRRAVLAGIAAAMSIGGLAAAITPASAAVRPLTAQGCSVNTCIRLDNPSGGKVEIQAWAYETTFYGHFELTGPNGLVSNSATETWQSGGGSNEKDRATWHVSATVGTYCMTGWEPSGSTYIKLGTTCRNVE